MGDLRRLMSPQHGAFDNLAFDGAQSADYDR
jgi:hypothetical protein